MFVPWLELTTLGMTAERDIDGTGVPIGKNDRGVYFWQPGRDGSLVVSQTGGTPAGVHELGAAVAERAMSLGVKTKRPRWKDKEVRGGDLDKWVEVARNIIDERKRDAGPHEPLVFFVPNCECGYWGYYSLTSLGRRIGELVADGPSVGVYLVVSFRLDSRSERLSGPVTLPRNLVTAGNAVVSIVGRPTGYDPRHTETQVLTRADCGNPHAVGTGINLLARDRILRGRWE